MLKEVFYMLNKKNSDKLHLHKKQDNSKLLFKKDFEKFDFDFKNMLGWTNYPNYCFATIIDNKIVSCASAGYHADKIDDSIIEVTVATHKDYRGKSYAVSNLVALCEYAMNMREKREIHYMTGIDNIAARKTAVSAGLIKTRFSYILLRKLISKLS
jgi:predicted GNAT family acetyltransferase